MGRTTGAWTCVVPLASTLRGGGDSLFALPDSVLSDVAWASNAACLVHSASRLPLVSIFFSMSFVFDALHLRRPNSPLIPEAKGGSGRPACFAWNDLGCSGHQMQHPWCIPQAASLWLPDDRRALIILRCIDLGPPNTSPTPPQPRSALLSFSLPRQDIGGWNLGSGHPPV